MSFAELLSEAFGALRSNRSRTLLTGLGVTVGTHALVMILSLSLGLSEVLDNVVASDEQLRQVIVIPGFGTRAVEGQEPEVEGVMSDEKRARLRKTLAKRSRGGPALQMSLATIDRDAERELAAIPGVESVRPFIQDRFEVSLVVDGEEHLLDRDVLSFSAPAAHPYYPRRLIGGSWFEDDDQPGAVVHELLLYDLGFTSDAAQAALVGSTLRLTARTRPRSGMMEVILGAPLRSQNKRAPVLYTEDVPIVGVVRESFGQEPASIVEEGWTMQTDVLFAQGYARTLWERVPGRDGLRGLVLVAESMNDVYRIEQETQKTGLRARSIRTALERMKQGLSGATLVAGFLAAIALFVSGLGIVNTLVMSVMERTREIGLLKALGARDRTISLLFVTEGALIGLLGGSVGVAVSYVLSLAGDWFARREIEEALFMPFDGEIFVFPWWLAAGGLGFAVGASLLAAVVPALRAARVDPVDALRHE